MLFRTIDHRGCTVPLVSPGRRFFWPFGRARSPQHIAASAIGGVTYFWIVCWILLFQLFLLLFLRELRGLWRGGLENLQLLDLTIRLFVLSLISYAGARCITFIVRRLRRRFPAIRAALHAKGLCPSCGYALAEGSAATCSECGAVWSRGESP